MYIRSESYNVDDRLTTLTNNEMNEVKNKMLWHLELV